MQGSIPNHLKLVPFFIFVILFVGCQKASIREPKPFISPESITSEPPNLEPTLSPTSAPTLIPTTISPAHIPTAIPTITPQATSVATPFPIATPYPYPLSEITIPFMRARSFLGGQIHTRSILEESSAFTRYYIDYPSDDLTVTGIMHMPAGEGPFPVLILLHGYYDRDRYFSGAGTTQAAEHFAKQGYLVLAPDFRSWGESDSGISLFHMGLVTDVLNLISSISSINEADPGRIGIWGHSMGGGIATKVLTIDERVKAAVLYAPNSADDRDLIDRWGPGCLPRQSEKAGDKCNPAEIIPEESSHVLAQAYLSAATSSAYPSEIAPLFHLEHVVAPVQIHIGTADGASIEQTPPEWSEKLAGALQARGKEVDYFVYPEQGHFFQGESFSIMLDRALQLFDAELKP